MLMRTVYLLMVPAVASVLAMLNGCAAPSTNSATDVAAERYPAAFDAARLVLRDMHFDLERVDARIGVITTAAKPTAGLATPWDREQQSAGQEIEDMLQHQQRVVRITFEPTPVAPGEGEPALIDLVEAPEPTMMRVKVYIERVHRPNWRVDSTSIRLHSYAYDEELDKRDMVPSYDVAVAEDRDLAARLAEMIRSRLAGGASRR